MPSDSDQDVITLDQALEIARNHLARGEPNQAYAYWENMRSVNPGHITVLTLKADLLDWAGRSAEASVAWKQVALLRENEFSHNNLNQALHLLQNSGFKPNAALDVGAHSGSWTKELLKIFPNTRSLMIEAQPERLTQVSQVPLHVVVDPHRPCQFGQSRPASL